MSAASGEPAGYRVSYTGRAQERLVELAAVAKARGDGEEYLAALREFDRRLRVYPQFGDPLADLLAGAGQVRLGAAWGGATPGDAVRGVRSAETGTGGGLAGPTWTSG